MLFLLRERATSSSQDGGRNLPRGMDSPRSLSTIPVEPSLLSKCFFQGNQSRLVILLGAF